MEFRFVHFYPDLMNLYGSYANLSVLGRRLEAAGHTVRVDRVEPGAPAGELSDADFLFMGAGTEWRQKAALADFLRYGDQVRAAAEDGMPMLFAGTAMELLGASITDADGTVFPALGLAAFTSVQGRTRFVEDVYGGTDLFPEPVVGFMNKCSRIEGVETPLLTQVMMGWGNTGERTPEGFHCGNVFASELTGPLLVKNPRLLDEVAGILCRRRGLTLSPAGEESRWAAAGYAVTAEQLRLRSEKR